MSNVEPLLLQKLGEIVIASAETESLTAEFLSYLVQADAGSMYVITQDTNAKIVTKWARTLTEIRIKDPNDKAWILNLLRMIDEARGDRNALVHGLWISGPFPGTALVHTIKWERSDVIRVELTTLEDLNDLLADLSVIKRDLYALGQHLGFVS